MSATVDSRSHRDTLPNQVLPGAVGIPRRPNFIFTKDFCCAPFKDDEDLEVGEELELAEMPQNPMVDAASPVGRLSHLCALLCVHL